MARAIGRLTALKVERAKEPGMYADGGGLYLRVTSEGARNWVCATCSIAGRAGWGLVRSRCMALQKPARGHWTRDGSGMRE